MELTQDFRLGSIENDFRYLVTEKLSTKALENEWKTKDVIASTDNNGTFAFSHNPEIDYDNPRVHKTILENTHEVFDELKGIGYCFDEEDVSPFGFIVSRITFEQRGGEDA